MSKNILIELFYSLFTSVNVQDNFYYELSAPSEALDSWAQLLCGMRTDPVDIRMPALEAIHSLQGTHVSFPAMTIQVKDITYQTEIDPVSPAWHVDHIGCTMFRDGVFDGRYSIRLDFEDGYLRSMRMVMDIQQIAA